MTSSGQRDVPEVGWETTERAYALLIKGTKIVIVPFSFFPDLKLNMMTGAVAAIL